ncbi:exo-alpha-sialidase [Candidatus Sumerlaeota bacterium]|nr:exo-alpha-sialidase [Candidatus Sumerlaeota bacterium]
MKTMRLWFFTVGMLVLTNVLLSEAPKFGFNPPRPANPDYATDTRIEGYFPAIATDGKGRFVAVWSIFPFGVSQISYIMQSVDGGMSWTQPAVLGNGICPDVATDGQGLWSAIWSSSWNGLGPTFVSRSVDNGNNWSAPIQVTDASSGGLELAKIRAGMSGHWIVLLSAWEKNAENWDSDILIVHSFDNGLTWSAPSHVNGDFLADGYEDIQPQVETDGMGNWVVIWTRYLGSVYNGPSDIIYARSSDDGLTWSAPLRLHPDAPGSQNGHLIGECASIQTDRNGTWIAAWSSNAPFGADPGGERDIFIERSQNAGLTWSEPEVVNSDAASDTNADSFPKIEADDQGTWAIVWNKLVSIPETSFTPSVNADSKRGKQGLIHPALIATPPPASYRTEIRIAVSTDQGMTWSSQGQAVAPDSTINPTPTIISDALGRWLLLWPRFPEAPSLQAESDIYTAMSPDLNPRKLVELNFSGGSGTSFWWTGVTTRGNGSTQICADGLCLAVPAAGENIAQFISPERTLPLVANTIWRLSAEVSTDQTDRDAIPMWQMGYDNMNSDFGKGDNYGGMTCFLDAAKGSQGIGRRNGRTNFETWIMPVAGMTPQWNGALSDDTLGAFAPENDPFNDIRLWFRVTDLESGGYGANLDSGTICLRSLRARRYSLADLQPSETLYGTPISNATHWAYDRRRGSTQSPMLAAIDDTAHLAHYQLDTTNDIATFMSARDLRPPLGRYKTPSFYPIKWTDNTLYRVTAQIQLAETSTGLDPVDMIRLNVETATKELIQTNWTSRGADEVNMLRAGSPRKASVAGGPQNYMAFFYGNNASDGKPKWSRLLRPTVDLINSPDLYGTGSGADATQIVGLKVERMILPAD